MNGTAVVNWRLAEIEREKFEQSHAASALQRVLLFASDVIGTGAGLALCIACGCISLKIFAVRPIRLVHFQMRLKCFGVLTGAAG